MRTKVTKENVKVGMFVMTSGGCTMRHVKFYQVIGIKGARVTLGSVEIKNHTDQYGQEGQLELLGAYGPNLVMRTGQAKFTKNGLQLTDSDWNIGGYFDSLTEAQIGQKEHYYGD